MKKMKQMEAHKQKGKAKFEHVKSKVFNTPPKQEEPEEEPQKITLADIENLFKFV
jgi:hypothetical protein